MPLPVKRKENTFESLQHYAFLLLHLSKLSKQHWIDMIVVANDPGCNVSPSLTLTLIRGLPYNKGCVNCSVLFQFVGAVSSKITNRWHLQTFYGCSQCHFQGMKEAVAIATDTNGN